MKKRVEERNSCVRSLHMKKTQVRVEKNISEYHAHFLNEINAILWVIDSNEHSNITKNQKRMC